MLKANVTQQKGLWKSNKTYYCKNKNNFNWLSTKKIIIDVKFKRLRNWNNLKKRLRKWTKDNWNHHFSFIKLKWLNYNKESNNYKIKIKDSNKQMKDFKQKVVAIENLILAILFKEAQQREVKREVVTNIYKIIPTKLSLTWLDWKINFQVCWDFMNKKSVMTLSMLMNLFSLSSKDLEHKSIRLYKSWERNSEQSRKNTDSKKIKIVNITKRQFKF